MLPTELLLEEEKLMFGLEMENYIVKCILEVQPCKRLSEVVSFEIFMSEW